jgi:hypothetical protein
MSDSVLSRPRSPCELRATLEEMVIADLLGPAGGAEEEIDERNVRDRYLVGVLAPRRQQQEPQAKRDDDDEDEDIPAIPDELSEGGADTVDDGNTDKDVPIVKAHLPSSFGMSFCVDKSATQAASTQMRVQLGQILHHGDRRGPVLLQELHASFDTRLLLRPTHQAKQRLEIVVARQRLITPVDLACSALQQMWRHRRWIVPPHLAWHSAVERQRFHQAVQDRLGPLGRQGDGEGAIGKRPRHHQYGNVLTPVGEVHVDVAEVRFEALARIVVERYERLTLATPAFTHVETHTLVTAGVTVLVAQPAPDFARRVALLARRLLVGSQDGVDRRLEWIED